MEDRLRRLWRALFRGAPSDRTAFAGRAATPHHREDEYSYVLTGKLGALLGEQAVTAGPGTWVFKPRNQWHTFWNAGDTPCEIIEVISPGGFEDFFRELTTAWGNPEQMSALGARYELDFDFESVPTLCERFGLTMTKTAN